MTNDPAPIGAEDIEQKPEEFAGMVPWGSNIPVLGPLAASNGAPLGGLQSILSNGLVGTGPPNTVGILSPEPVPPPYTDQQLIEAVTVSNDAVNRVLQRMPNYNKDPFVRGDKRYDDMKAHAAYNSPLRLKKYSILYKEKQTLPRVNGLVVKDDHPRYDRANEIADFCRYALENIMEPVTMRRQDFREVAWYFLDACHCGNSTQEVQWRVETKGKYKGKRIFAGFYPRSPKQITYNLDPLTNTVVSINNYTAMGWQSYLPLFRKFLVYTYQGEDGLPYGRGDARASYKHVFGLNELTRLWGVALQKHGAGFLHATVDNPQADYVKSVMTNLEAAMSASVIVDTPGVRTDLLQLTGGTLDAFVHPIKYNEEMIAKEVLGNILTTGQGTGSSSYALGGVHQASEEFFRAFPRCDLEDAVRNQIYFWLVYTNYGEEDLDCIPAHSQGVWDWEEQTLISKFIETFTNLGYMRPDFDTEWARKLAHMPMLPTTKELDTENPAILPDHEHVMITVAGKTYKSSLVKPDGATAGAKN